jgi:glycerophosphoryl diester phosphodiesterase
VAPEVVAHRGASRERPEHTLGAYREALRQGAGALECDVRLTRDGHLVCLHDRRVDRTSTGRGVVSASGLKELSTLDYGAWHDEMGESADDLVVGRTGLPSSLPAERGLLTFPALLELVVASPGVRLFVETKHPVRYSGQVEEALAALLRRFGLTDPAREEDSLVVTMSFSAAAMRRMRRLAPKLPNVLLTHEIPQRRRDGSLPRWASITGPDIAALRADPGYVERAAARGHPTYCWTVDDPSDVALCERLGVRYLATNSPATALSLLGK